MVHIALYLVINFTLFRFRQWRELPGFLAKSIFFFNKIDCLFAEVETVLMVFCRNGMLYKSLLLGGLNKGSLISASEMYEMGFIRLDSVTPILYNFA